MSPSALKIHLKYVLFHKCCRNLCVSMPRCVHDTYQWFCCRISEKFVRKCQVFFCWKITCTLELLSGRWWQSILNRGSKPACILKWQLSSHRVPALLANHWVFLKNNFSRSWKSFRFVNKSTGMWIYNFCVRMCCICIPLSSENATVKDGHCGSQWLFLWENVLKGAGTLQHDSTAPW
jgi:hypothetical protein